ncbi:MAG: GNAT family N-acetyltransferase [Oscillospiraceae bacterium]|nr:GNAT family N-acetyltransferase [Oscillospiraceae bacterium]
MIRKFEKQDLDAVMSIWLCSNIDAHAFINPDYLKKNFDIVKKMIPHAEVYLLENNHEIKGFIGMIENKIAGIFVNKSDRSKGIGTELLNFAKKYHKKLYLSVYEKNERAIYFYKKNGFKIEKINIDKDTVQKEYIMLWEQE